MFANIFENDYVQRLFQSGHKWTWIFPELCSFEHAYKWHGQNKQINNLKGDNMTTYILQREHKDKDMMPAL